MRPGSAAFARAAFARAASARAGATGAAAGALLALVLLLPPVASVLESRMALHMLVQIPALAVAGALLAGRGKTRDPAGGSGAQRLRAFDPGGVPGLLLAAGILTTWMIPRALDLAATQRGTDALKAATLLLAGALIRRSWARAGAITQAFVLGNMTWMAAVAGLLLRDAPVRLCTTYLEADQVHAGTGLLLLATAVGARWFLSLLGPVRGDRPHADRPHAEGLRSAEPAPTA